ncbi:hypothetical protein [uncultured Desulfobacter sp.]|uniref:hypothetical protein n=1 Tax=uncultured Desulfobacter sp. TaxID=240139 RepID=UPI002AABF4B6|nr:hypothetical protein [uncultured Desulfobacter sp.]
MSNTLTLSSCIFVSQALPLDIRAGIICHGGPILTMTGKNDWSQALAAVQGQILAWGYDDTGIQEKRIPPGRIWMLSPPTIPYWLCTCPPI